jgi:hypothetical protein
VVSVIHWHRTDSFEVAKEWKQLELIFGGYVNPNSQNHPPLFGEGGRVKTKRVPKGIWA